MAEIKHLNVSNFDSETSSGVSLVDFWAEWCGPCRMLGPILDDLAAKVDDNVLIAKVNVDEAQELASKYNVRSIPAIFILKDGEVVNQFVGVQDKTTLIKAIQDA